MLRGYPYRECYNSETLKRYVEKRDNQKPNEEGYTYTISTYETSLELLNEKYKRGEFDNE